MRRALAMERRRCGGGGGSDQDDDEPTEVMDHEGYEYEKPWMNHTTLWSCTVPGCGGQLSVTPVRSKRWRHRTVAVYRDARGGLTARKVCRQHNHPSVAAVGPERPGDLKVLSRNGKHMRYETKIMKSSSTQTKNIEKNIHSIKDDDTKKVFDNAKHTIGQVMEIPTVLNKIGLHIINDSNLEEVNKRITVCDTGVFKNKNTTVYDLKSHNTTEHTDFQKTAPLQLLRCKQCYLYVVQGNYLQHIDTVAHKVADLYYKSKIVQVIKGHYENDILSTRIVSTCNSDSIHDFFHSIEDMVKNLIGIVIQLINGPIKVFIKMFALYQKVFNQNSDSILGDVMTFMVKDEILTSNTVFWPWFEKISNTLKLNNQNYLNVECQKSHRLVRVMFLEIYFFKAPN